MAFSGDPVAFQMQLRFGVNCFFNVDTKRLVLPRFRCRQQDALETGIFCTGSVSGNIPKHEHGRRRSDLRMNYKSRSLSFTVYMPVYACFYLSLLTKDVNS